MCQRGFEKFFFHSVQHFWPSEDEEKVECCGNVQSLFFQQMLPRRCPQSQHCSGDIAVNDEEDDGILSDSIAIGRKLRHSETDIIILMSVIVSFKIIIIFPLLFNNI